MENEKKGIVSIYFEPPKKIKKNLHRGSIVGLPEGAILTGEVVIPLGVPAKIVAAMCRFEKPEDAYEYIETFMERQRLMVDANLND